MTARPKTTMPPLLQGLAALDAGGAAQSLNFLAAGAQFMTMRLDHLLKAQADLLACKTPAEMLEVQTGYIKTAAEHYLLGAQGVIDMLDAQVREGTRAAGVKRGYDDVPL